MLRSLGVALLVSLGAAPTLADPVGDARAKVLEVTDKAAAIEVLVGMGEVDRLARERFLAIRKDIPSDQRPTFDRAVGAEIEAMDKGHEQRLEALMAANPGWFPVSVYGPRAAGAALTIVNHSQNLAFRKKAMAQMERLVGAAELPSNYANVYDRTAIMEGRLQRYGTQNFSCVNGDYAVPTDVEAPEQLATRRAQLKLEPLAQSFAAMRQMYGPCVK